VISIDGKSIGNGKAGKITGLVNEKLNEMIAG